MGYIHKTPWVRWRGLNTPPGMRTTTCWSQLKPKLLCARGYYITTVLAMENLGGIEEHFYL
jgi:hypothetical protein